MTERTGTACLPCLRRAHLIKVLAPYIERHSQSRKNVLELLDLDTDALIETIAKSESIADVSEARLREELRSTGTWAICLHNPIFPPALADAPSTPHVLFGQGDYALAHRLFWRENVVAIAGARRASTYGRETARTLGHGLAAAGKMVVSGLAFGVDACAHRGALEGGTTVAVLGNGVNTPYPVAHRSLWRRIRDNNGLILSEHAPDATPWRWTFPARNRIIAALANTTVVVEATQQSGSMITANLAADMGRDLCAVPGPVSSLLSAGPNGLLHDGAARIVRDADDVLRPVT